MISCKKYRSKYQILHALGQGQHGRVLCAVNRHTNELVALKELDRQRFPTRMFLRELGFLVTLQHPNLVGCRGLEYSPTNRYLVMDYCQGGTLRDLMESQRLEPQLCLKLIADILAGLQYAGDRQIVHRDLKPENILLEPDGDSWTARIADFGIARLVGDANWQDSGDTGSPAYMASEQFYGRYYHSSDLYAVGVMLYELLVGSRPFSGTYAELKKSHLNQKVNVPDTVPLLLRSTITKALHKLPQRRFKSAAEMLKPIQLATVVVNASK